MAEKIIPQLWTPRSVEETQKIYAKWGATYDADMVDWGYVTPSRIAEALVRIGTNTDLPVFDFGCGTGLCGRALAATGFTAIDGSDISAEMLEKAKAQGVYRTLWTGTPGSLTPVKSGDYPVITASGVVSLGAAPPETLDMLAGALPPGGLLAFSYNEATMGDAAYTDKLTAITASPAFTTLFEETGPHLPAKNMTSTIYIIARS